jgi:hypothetical protein
MPWGPAYWQLNARSYRRDVDTFISDAQLWRSDIDSERDGAQKRAAESKRNNPDVFIELSKLLDDAERFLENGKVARPSYKQMWDGRLVAAQGWEVKNLRRVLGQIRKMVRRVKDCQSEAEQLRELVAETRLECQL